MRKAICTILIMLCTAAVWAQGILSGTITDGKTGEPVMTAELSLTAEDSEEPVAATMSEIDGTFSLSAPQGIYELHISAFGFQTKIITDVEIINKKTNAIQLTLTEPAKNELDEVVVRASLRKENISALYTLQRSSATVSDGISADIIKKSPDRSTGEVLKRVSGTTIQDNKFVVVRGMSDRYNIALIDNATLPSTEPNRRAFSFDIIPSGMVDNIVVSKSATPDLPGDFAGGVINILTKEVPDQNFNTLSLGTGFNTVSTFKNFRSGQRGATDFLGFDNGLRQLPATLPAASELTAVNLNPEQSEPYLQSLQNNFSIKEHQALPPISFQGAMGRVYRLNGDRRFGFSAALTYNHSEAIGQDIERKYDSYDYTDNRYTYSSNLGALLNLGYYSGNSKITLKTLYNKIFDDNFLYRTGTNESSGSEVRYYAFDLVQKGLFKTTLSGEHGLVKSQNKLNWIISYNKITNNQPDQKKVLYARNIGSDNPFAASITTLGKANNRLFSNLDESITNGGLNYTAPLNWWHASNFKAGLFAQYRYRDFNNRYLGAVLEPGFEDIRTRPVESLFADDAIAQGAYTLVDQTGAADQYHAHTTTLAGYAMMDNRFTEKLRAVWGLRAEQYHLSLVSEETVSRNWIDIMPSVNLTWALNSASNLRLAWFRSVARPEMREISNVGYYDYELSATMLGNTALQRSRIDNIDFRYEWYPAPGEVISASVFYKKFNNTLENYVNAANSSYDITTRNYKGATNLGVEFELRKKLDFISTTSFFKNLSAYLNLAYVHSEVDMSGAQIWVNGIAIKHRPLSGQSPFVINSSLAYVSNNGKWSATVLYNRIAQRLYLVGGDRLGFVYERPRNLLDVQLSYALSLKSELRFNVKDILNNPVVFYFDQDANQRLGSIGFSADGRIDPARDWILQRYQPGTTYSLSYSLKF